VCAPFLPTPVSSTVNGSSQCSYVDVLVIGAGPTGLGAAKRLNQLVGLPTTMDPKAGSQVTDKVSVAE
jgi:threonine dehydrogenase-like Zn-dependent dehydrogenase